MLISYSSSDSKLPSKLMAGEFFGKLSDGREVKAFRIVNIHGLEMTVITYGGIITSLNVPDREGKLGDIVLGYDLLSDYEQSNPYFGAIIGRFGNRIAKGKFTLDGKHYDLAINNIGNHLHGGIYGFDKVIWDGTYFENEKGSGVKLSYTSPDGEEGYPGELKIEVIYTLGEDNTLSFDYRAITNKSTIVNLTQHSYFNLTGGKENIYGHELTLNANTIVPVDSTLIPTGKFLEVAGGPLDFTSPKMIGKDIDAAHEQLTIAGGYDHTWVINQNDAGESFVASVYEPKSGRLLEVTSSEPGVQFYSGNFLDGKVKGKKGIDMPWRSGFCLETQHFPDSPNQLGFPSVRLDPGQEYHTITRLKFSTRK